MGLISRVSSRTYRSQFAMASQKAKLDPVHYGKRNVEELKQEWTRLSQNNDRLVNLIATNNASKQTIESLRKKLEYAKRSTDEKQVVFSHVDANLNKEQEEAEQKSNAAEALRDVAKGRQVELGLKKQQLKKEKEKLEQEENALTVKIPDETAPKFNDEKFIDDLLKKYALQFGIEYEKLLKKAQDREKILLQKQLEVLLKANAEKTADLEKLREEMIELAKEMRENEKKIKEQTKILEALDNTKNKEADDNNEKKRKLESEVESMEKKNEDLKKKIEATQKSANEALLVIIQLEFEIKTYEKLLKMERQMDDFDTSDAK